MSPPSPRAALILTHSVRKAHFKGCWGAELQPGSHIRRETSLALSQAPGPLLYGGELPSWQRGVARGDGSCIASAADADVCDRRGGCQETASSSSGTAQPTPRCAGDVMLLRHRSLPACPVSPCQRWRGKRKSLYSHSCGLPQSAFCSLPSYGCSEQGFAKTGFSVGTKNALAPFLSWVISPIFQRARSITDPPLGICLRANSPRQDL